MHGPHDQKSLHETCLSGFEEREGAFIMATNMTNSEAMVTSAAPYTTESTQTYPQGMSEARQALESILHLSSAFEI